MLWSMVPIGADDRVRAPRIRSCGERCMWVSWSGQTDPELLVGLTVGSGSATAVHAVHGFRRIRGQRPAVVEVGHLGAVGELDAERDELRDGAAVLIAKLERSMRGEEDLASEAVTVGSAGSDGGPTPS
jgi:hypothetical protein